MLAVAITGTLLAFVIVCWLIRLGIEQVLNRVFGSRPQPGPRRHRPF